MANVTKICNACEEPGPWQRVLRETVRETIEGIDEDENGRMLIGSEIDRSVNEGVEFVCCNCGRRYPGGIWWNGLDEVTTN